MDKSVVVILPETISSKPLIYKKSEQKDHPDLLQDVCIELQLNHDINQVYETLAEAGCITIITFSPDTLLGWFPKEITSLQYSTIQKLKKFILNFSYFEFTPWFDNSFYLYTRSGFSQESILEMLYDQVKLIVHDNYNVRR